jgi:hypothetical protein
VDRRKAVAAEVVEAVVAVPQVAVAEEAPRAEVAEAPVWHWRRRLARTPTPATEARIFEDFSYSFSQKLRIY